jgi:hypothetical protein
LPLDPTSFPENRMRNYSKLVLLAVAAVVTFLVSASVAAAQATPPIKVEKDRPASGHSMEHMSGWKELDAYHMVMMGVWHPAKESNDLKPIRARADSLAIAGDAWAKAAVPKSCDSPENRANIARVNADSKALAAKVKDGSDADVMAALKALHDRFELVNRGCKAHHMP